MWEMHDCNINGGVPKTPYGVGFSFLADPGQWWTDLLVSDWIDVSAN